MDRPFGEQDFGVGTVLIPKASYPLIRVATEQFLHCSTNGRGC